jgi:flagellar biosynthesis anti-sigma factor FlgM
MRIEGLNNLPNIKKLEKKQSRPVETPAKAPSASATDSVQISSEAKVVSNVYKLPVIRHEKVSSVKAEIEKGTYLTPEKLNKALDALLKDLL